MVCMPQPGPPKVQDKAIYRNVKFFWSLLFSIIILEIPTKAGEGFSNTYLVLLKSSDNSHPHFYFNTKVDMHCISDIQREGIGTSLHCCSPSVKLANKCEKKFWKK